MKMQAVKCIKFPTTSLSIVFPHTHLYTYVLSIHSAAAAELILYLLMKLLALTQVNMSNKECQEQDQHNSDSYIAALDVGTSSVRCFIYNEHCCILNSVSEDVELLSTKLGYYEIEPETLWRKIVHVIHTAIKGANLQPKQIRYLALSTQRGSFVTWNHRTQEYYHNFITWKDVRASGMVNAWNNSRTLKALNALAYAAYLVTRSKRHKAASMLQMMNGHVTLRLLHEMQHNGRLQQALKAQEARVELLDSWLLYKLRSGNGIDTFVSHISDISSCTATGLFDPFTLSWSPIVSCIFGISPELLPIVVDNSAQNLGKVHELAFVHGQENAVEETAYWKDIDMRISCSVSDQTAALWGANCFHEGEVKITLGTGAFLNLICGPSCPAPLAGMYPLVAWQLADGDKVRTAYCLEAAVHDFGTIIKWAQNAGFFQHVHEIDSLAAAVEHTDGVYFMPAFDGFGPPINDHSITCGFIGIKLSTKREHLLRAILEAMVFRLVFLCQTLQLASHHELKTLRINGGVSRNNFICQCLADASGLHVERSKTTEASVLGAALIAGLNSGIWHEKDIYLNKFYKIDCIFEPAAEHKCKAIRQRMQHWQNSIQRFANWNSA